MMVRSACSDEREPGAGPIERHNRPRFDLVAVSMPSGPVSEQWRGVLTGPRYTWTSRGDAIMACCSNTGGAPLTLIDKSGWHCVRFGNTCIDDCTDQAAGFPIGEVSASRVGTRGGRGAWLEGLVNSPRCRVCVAYGQAALQLETYGPCGGTRNEELRTEGGGNRSHGDLRPDRKRLPASSEQLVPWGCQDPPAAGRVLTTAEPGQRADGVAEPCELRPTKTRASAAASERLTIIGAAAAGLQVLLRRIGHSSVIEMEL